MTAFRATVSRWIVATLVVFGALQQCESFSFTLKPPRVVRVVEGATRNLRWEFTSSASRYFVVFSRQRPGKTVAEQIATRSESSAFTFVEASFITRYTASLPATLRLKSVKRGEEYVYIFSILNAFGVVQLRDRVTVEVVVPPTITTAPVREPQLNTGQNYTLKCNAFGDPHPNITWSKDGVPVNQFNISGPLLHLVNVKRKDAGSYRCTASNRYGDDATSVSIVGIQCRYDCTVKIVGISLQSEEWKSALSNQASVEFMSLESRLLSAIWSTYTKNPAKQLYKVNVVRFRSGSVFATVELLFGKSATDPLKPLQDKINDGKLGSFIVDRTLVVNPTAPTTLPPTTTTPPTTAPPESFSLILKPTRIVRVVEGTTRNLRWEFTASARRYFVAFSRQRQGEIVTEQIATRSESSAFSFVKDSYRTRYTPLLPATLRLKSVKRDEEYVYILSILNEFGVVQLRDRVTVEVVVPPTITTAPVREPQLNTGQNYTLKCNAFGDPHPNITWSKDGVPVNQFNISGPLLHLVNVQRKDAGSYRCTASNGYGDDATSVSIVGIQCRYDCTVKIAGISLQSEEWKPPLSNQASVEFMSLESRLLTAIWSSYTKNPAKQLYKVNVVRFRSGSVFATVELLFGKSATDPLKPLQDEINDGKLGSFIVDRTLVVNPTAPTTLPPTTTTPPTTAPPESFSLILKPTRIVRVVEGTTRNLRWEFTASARRYFVAFSRQRQGEIVTEQIATRSESSAFSFVKDSYRTRYTPLLPATLRLKSVKRDEEYVYILSILNEFGVVQLRDRVTVEVVVPPIITTAPVREPQLNTGQNYTLKCNAFGDPHPNITWSKDGVPVNQFNISGPLLHLVNVKRKDAGSYRCTASNRYGDDATSVSIVGIQCRYDCTVKIAGISLQSEEWKPPLSNQASVEFMSLESRLLTAIWSTYTKNPAKQLYKVNVVRFRSGSVFATVELLFGKSTTDPLKPLQDEINDGKLGSFIVDRTLVVNPMQTTTLSPTTMPSKTTASKVCIADNYKGCGCFKLLGFCGVGSPFYDFMVKNCNATCGECQLCIADKYKGCRCFKLLGFCGVGSPFFDFMVKNCNATCGECQPPTTMTPSTAPQTTMAPGQFKKDFVPE